MATVTEIREAFKTWFAEPGAYVLVDGQYGSTGKGVIAAALGQAFGHQVSAVTTNAGPNSGHTSYMPPAGPVSIPDAKERQVVLKQLPTFAVAALHHCYRHIPVYVNGGAVVDLDLLRQEIHEHLGGHPVYVHPSAALITPEDRQLDLLTVQRIAGTGQGVGEALVRKIRRTENAVFGYDKADAYLVPSPKFPWVPSDRIFVETSQGFSLGPNSGFYPYTTSRECTVGQALADAAIAPQRLRKVVMSVRTFPIRVGNTQGSSGPCYPDQREIQWSDIGVEPELTTVTKRVRRVFTWSRQQFIDSLVVNRPDALFVNFMNYIPVPQDQREFLHQLYIDYHSVMGKDPETVVLGFGPRTADLEIAKAP
jgi:adenylosuccinate synthase